MKRGLLLALLAAPSCATAERPTNLTTRATLERVEEIDATGHCPQEQHSTCEAFLLHLSEAEPQPPCRFIAVNYIDDNGHRYVRWPETLVLSDRRRWTLIGELNADGDCFYALMDAK